MIPDRNIRPIKTEQDYEAALVAVEGLMDAKPGTPDGDVLDVLVTLIEAYEAKRWVIELPDPIEAIRSRMTQRNLRPRDLKPFLGSSGRVSEVLNRRRPLTLPMIRRLEEGLGIPARILVREPDAGTVRRGKLARPKPSSTRTSAKSRARSRRPAKGR